MNIFEDLKATLNGTLEIALGIEKVNSMINPKKAHTDGKNLVNISYKEIDYLSKLSKTRYQHPVKKVIKGLTKINQVTKSFRTPKIRGSEFKKNLSFSIKNINNRVVQSRAGKKIVGQVLQNENLSFNSSYEKSFSSRTGTPRPTSLPFVSFRTGKVEDSMNLPSFQEYLEAKGSNYMKTGYNDEILNRLDRASAKITKFTEEFDTKAQNFLRSFEDRNKRASIIRIPLFNSELKSPGLRSVQRSSVNRKIAYSKDTERGLSKTQPVFFETIHGFNQARLTENKRFLDILDKIDLERPLNVRQKVDLIQNDHEKFRNRMHSIEKFERFRCKVESTRRNRQSNSKGQGKIYMTIIESFRLQRYKPSLGEIEVLEYWKKMVELGWVISQNDLVDLKTILISKSLLSPSTSSLLSRLQKALASIS